MKKVGEEIETPMIGEEQTRVLEFTCEETGKTFKGEQYKIFESWFPIHKFHPDIVKRKQREHEEQMKIEQVEKNLSTWRIECPKIFQETDLDRLDRQSCETVLKNKWASMVLHGVTGSGKTRMLWEFLRRGLSSLKIGGRGWIMISSRKLADELSDAVFRNQHEYVLAKYQRIKLLLIDDVGKETMTKRWATDFFDIIDTRTSNKLQTIFSTNYTGKKFVGKFATIDEELAQATNRRIKDFFLNVNFRTNVDTDPKN
jgi:DNA replication protein DnaC